MGIDIYLEWNDITKEEKKEQYTGFSIDHGHVGYLREAYHGGPYATQVLVPEAFRSQDGTACIPAKVLRERLPEAICAVITRAREIYNEEVDENNATIKSFINFVELAEKKEDELGEPCTVIASY